MKGAELKGTGHPPRPVLTGRVLTGRMLTGPALAGAVLTGAVAAVTARGAYAALRRYLVDEGFLERRDGFYWRVGGTFDIDP